MSGFVGLVTLDGGAPDMAMLQSCVEALKERGPDAVDCRRVGRAGLGHTLLRTTEASVDERQPWTLDDGVWITGDARLDARIDLVDALRARGDTLDESHSDIDLIVRAYRRWDEACVERLFGDFAFAIWDEPRQRLLCARDQLGLKPLFYAVTSAHVIASNTLDCIRRHPGVSRALNELAIADFLVTGENQDPASTVFEQVQRLPPAHVLTWDAQHGVRTRRYWTMPIDRPIRFRRSADYVERFREVFGLAVADRLRTDRAVIFMSGGLDSTSVALAARQNARSEVHRCDVLAYTGVYERLIPDEERRFAEAAAEALGIKLRVFVLDDDEPCAHWGDAAYRTAEPNDQVFVTANRRQQREASGHARVALTGYGADPLFVHLTDVIGSVRRRDPRPILADVARALAAGRLPPIAVRTTWRSWRSGGRRTTRAVVPPWLDPAFVRRLGLKERYAALGPVVPGEPHPTRELSRRNVLDPLWSRVFDAYDAGMTRCPLEYRHPFFDLRVMRYVWAIPAVPWSQQKELLRAAMRGHLPDAVSERRKTPLGGDPLVAWCENGSVRDRLRTLVTTPRSTCCPEAFPPALDDPSTIWTDLRPLALEHWLQTSGLAMTRARGAA